MQVRALLCSVIVSAIYVGSANVTFAEATWVTITDPQEVRQLMSGKAIDGKYWMHFYRADGNMAYYYPENKAMTVRKWTIEDDGRLCSAIFSMPERVIDCFSFRRSSDDPAKYQMKWSSGVSAFEFFDTPPAILVDALNEKAGPMK